MLLQQLFSNYIQFHSTYLLDDHESQFFTPTILNKMLKSSTCCALVSFDLNVTVLQKRYYQIKFTSQFSMTEQPIALPALLAQIGAMVKQHKQAAMENQPSNNFTCTILIDSISTLVLQQGLTASLQFVQQVLALAPEVRLVSLVHIDTVPFDTVLPILHFANCIIRIMNPLHPIGTAVDDHFKMDCTLLDDERQALEKHDFDFVYCHALSMRNKSKLSSTTEYCKLDKQTGAILYVKDPFEKSDTNAAATMSTTNMNDVPFKVAGLTEQEKAMKDKVQVGVPVTKNNSTPTTGMIIVDDEDAMDDDDPDADLEI